MAAIQFDTRMGELGGQRMLTRGVGDDRDEELWGEWIVVGEDLFGIWGRGFIVFYCR